MLNVSFNLFVALRCWTNPIFSSSLSLSSEISTKIFSSFFINSRGRENTLGLVEYIKHHWYKKYVHGFLPEQLTGCHVVSSRLSGADSAGQRPGAGAGADWQGALPGPGIPSCHRDDSPQRNNKLVPALLAALRLCQGEVPGVLQPGVSPHQVKWAARGQGDV